MPADLPPFDNRPSPESSPDGAPSAPRPAGSSPQNDGGSLHIATVAGIPIRIHFTFLLLFAWFVLSPVETPAGKTGAAPGATVSPWLNALFVLALFGCVTLHELGHALTARRYGIRTRDITLYPIGGIARLETLPRPRQELWIALAGPAVNLGIAVILYGGLQVMSLRTGITPANVALPGFAARLLWANLLLAGFNMIPAFPMDGGRVLRALLARVTDDVSATAIAARIGQGIAILFGLVGLGQGNLFLVFIAILVYMAAGQEAAIYQTKALVTGHRVREAMLSDFRTLTVGNTLGEAADLLLAGSQHDFPVVHGDEVVGVLSRAALLRGLAKEGASGYVAGAMEREFLQARPDDELETLLAQTMPTSPILVMEPDAQGHPSLVGMITQENLLEFLMLTQVRSSQPARP